MPHGLRLSCISSKFLAVVLRANRTVRRIKNNQAGVPLVVVPAIT
jgi:hypothetical protein